MAEKRFLDVIWQILISSFVLSLILLVPLGIKWELPKKITVPGSITVGFITALIVRGIVAIGPIKFWQIVILQLFLIIGISASLLLWRFFRDPERVPPEDQNVILSPADGKVIYVKRIEKGTVPYSEKNRKKFHLTDFTGSQALPTEGFLIGIAMNFLNVHVNRSPMDGTISSIHHIHGGFASLKREEAVLLNERALTVIDNGYFKIGIVQIASRLVRNIVSYLQEGHEVRQGERIGMIRFGSQVDLILPSLPFLRVEVNPGIEVKAGISLMARIMPGQPK